MPDLKFVRRLSILILFCAAFTAQLNAQSSIALQNVVTSGLTSPVFVTSAHDGTGRLFIVQQNGIIKVLQPGAVTPTDYLNISTAVVFTGDERGLLGLAFHPQFRSNRRFFVYYTRTGDGFIQIAEYRQNISNPNIADNSGTVIISIPRPGNAANHNGGTVAFGSDGFLYAAPGDGGSTPDAAQRLDTLLGKVIRIDIDNFPQGQTYGIPPTNPYAGATTGLDEIYAIGLRNPYRFSFDTRLPGQRGLAPGPWPLWLADVGQSALEEIDLVTLGGNYGWCFYEGTNARSCGPAPSGHSPPIFQYDRSNGRCSIIGGYVYRGRRQTFPNGSYVYGDLCSGEIFLYRGEAINTPPVVLLDTSMTIVAFGRDDRGEMYVVSFGSPSGAIHKIVPAGSGAASEGVPRRGRRR